MTSLAAPRKSLLTRQQLALVVLLAAELLLLTLRFDTQSLDQIPSIWARLIGWSPQFLRLGITIAVASLLLASNELASAISRNDFGATRAARLLSLSLHALALIVFVQASSIVMGGALSSVAHPTRWAVVWLATGLTTLAAWGLTLFPLATWKAAIHDGRIGIFAGIAVGTVVWAAGFLTEELWAPLAHYTFALVNLMLRLIYPATISNPATLEIGTPAFSVMIAPQCSGYEGVGLILAFMTIYLWLFRSELRFPRALLLLPIGAAAIWIINALRLVALIVIGTAGWRSIALGGFHSQAGWLAFNLVGLGLVGLTIQGRLFSTRQSATESTAAVEGTDPTSAFLAPFVALMATAMLTGAMTADFEWLYPVRLASVAAVLWMFRRTYADLSWTLSWQAVGIGAVTFVLWLALLPTGTNGNAPWAAALGSVPWYWAGAWLLTRVIGYVVAVPLAEELAFRGFLSRRLVRAEFHRVPMGTYAFWPFVISSLLFGALHGALWLPGTVAGMAFALAMYRRRALGDAVLAHATTNGLLAIYAVTTGQWFVWT